MSNKILPNAICLITMTDDELREELCKDIYNKANSHEMIRRLAKLAMDYAELADSRSEIIAGYRSAIEQIERIAYEAKCD